MFADRIEFWWSNWLHSILILSQTEFAIKESELSGSLVPVYSLPKMWILKLLSVAVTNLQGRGRDESPGTVGPLTTNFYWCSQDPRQWLNSISGARPLRLFYFISYTFLLFTHLLFSSSFFCLSELIPFHLPSSNTITVKLSTDPYCSYGFHPY